MLALTITIFGERPALIGRARLGWRSKLEVRDTLRTVTKLG
jgi:hypothetical protein